METGQIRVGDVGTAFIITVQDENGILDLSGFTGHDVIFRTSTGERLVKAGTLATDGKDGKLRYTTIANDIDTPGIWKFQVSLTGPAGVWKSSIETFEVFASL